MQSHENIPERSSQAHVEVAVRELVNGIKELGEIHVNWTALLGISVTLVLSVSFWAAIIDTTVKLVK